MNTGKFLLIISSNESNAETEKIVKYLVLHFSDRSEEKLLSTLVGGMRIIVRGLLQKEAEGIAQDLRKLGAVVKLQKKL